MSSHTEDRIAIDLVPYAPGKGGSGGGIWTYAESLVKSIDREVKNTDLNIYCLTCGDHLDNLKNVNLVKFNHVQSSILRRLFWTHVHLPYWCHKNNVQLLHKLSTEIPLFYPSDIITTVHDFVNRYYEECGIGGSVEFYKYVARKYFNFIEIISFKKSSHILVPTKFIKEQAIELYGLEPSKIKVTYEGVEGKKGSGNTNVNTSGRKLLYVAGFYPHKSHIEAVDAFDMLMEKYNFEGDNTNLVFRGHVSDKGYYTKVKSKVKQSNFSERIKIKGYDPNISKYEIYENADILLSLSCYEGFGLPLIEAQEYGVPVVASNIPTFKETVGSSALLVDPSNSEEVADSIHRLLSNDNLYKRVVKSGLKNASNFKWKNTAKKTIESYKKLV